jgi:hypothetical protein
MAINSIKFLMRGFLRDRRGSIAMISAIMAPALTLAAVGGIDYGMVVSCRMKVDAAAYSAILHGAHVARETQALNPMMSQAEVKAIGEAAAVAHFIAAAPACVTDAGMSATIAFIGDTISVAGDYTGKAPTRILQIAGIPTVDMAGKTQGMVASDGGSDPNMPIDEKLNNPGTKAVAGPLLGFYSAFNGWQTPAGQTIEILPRSLFGGVPPSPSGHEMLLELDREDNSRLSKRVLLQKGDYELRYWYFGRVPYNTYTPAWICGTEADALMWADAISGTTGAQTNRVSVFLDAVDTGSPSTPPAPLPGSRIDTCVDSGSRWIERSVKIRIGAPGPFWLTFAAEGASEGLGGLLNHIRLCRNACDQVPANQSPPPRDNFPWAANTELFTDNFVLPSGVWPSPYFRFYTLNQSGTNAGWSTLPSGWTTTPVNQVELIETNRDNRLTYVLGLDTFSDPRATTTNRSIHRRFLLAPGFYRVSYLYSVVDDMRVNQVHCGVNTYQQDLATVANRKVSTRSADTNVLAVFVDSDVPLSSPRHAMDLFASASWRMWNNAAPPPGTERIGLTMVDVCVNADNTRVVERSVTFRINKPGFYWLTFATLGAGDEVGPRLDNVALTGIGGLSTPGFTNAVTVPAPGTPFGSWIKRGRFEEIEVQVQ